MPGLGPDLLKPICSVDTASAPILDEGEVALFEYISESSKHILSYFILFSWRYSCHAMLCKVEGKMGRFGAFPYRGIAAGVVLANTFSTLHNCRSSFVLRTVKISSLCGFEVYNTVLLSIITTWCISHFI